jgi:dihydroxyacid dehydratase/phosphogluconate dehydratase
MHAASFYLTRAVYMPACGVCGVCGLRALLCVQDELERRRAVWEPPAEKYSCGVLHKYSKLVNSASQGATLAREHSGSLFRNR